METKCLSRLPILVTLNLLGAKDELAASYPVQLPSRYAPLSDPFDYVQLIPGVGDFVSFTVISGMGLASRMYRFDA